MSSVVPRTQMTMSSWDLFICSVPSSPQHYKPSLRLLACLLPNEQHDLLGPRPLQIVLDVADTLPILVDQSLSYPTVRMLCPNLFFL